MFLGQLPVRVGSSRNSLRPEAVFAEIDSARQTVGFRRPHRDVRLPRTVLVIQGGPSGRGTLLVDINLKVPPQYELRILNKAELNSYFNVNKSCSSTIWTTL